MMHEWGDEWFEKNGDDLYKAINYCIKTWRRYGRIGSFGKEKWGAFRDHIYFWDGTFTGLVFPGYVRIMWSKFYWNIDEPILKPIFRFLLVTKLFHWYQKQVYNFAIQKMCKKCPDIVDELVSDLEGYKMVKPGIFGKIDGTETHNKYWTTVYKVK